MLFPPTRLVLQPRRDLHHNDRYNSCVIWQTWHRRLKHERVTSVVQWIALESCWLDKLSRHVAGSHTFSCPLLPWPSSGSLTQTFSTISPGLIKSCCWCGHKFKLRVIRLSSFWDHPKPKVSRILYNTRLQKFLLLHKPSQYTSGIAKRTFLNQHIKCSTADPDLVLLNYWRCNHFLVQKHCGHL